MQYRVALGSAALVVPAVIAGIAVTAPRLQGQTESSGPFAYIHAVNSQPVTTPAATGLPNGPATSAQVLQGRYIVASAGCVSCHSHDLDDPNDPHWMSGYLGGTDAGSFAIGPFMTYAKNLTPDMATGIGMHSDRQIFNALRYGLAPDDTPDVVITSNVPGQGNFPAMPSYLAPPMPWPSFRHFSDADIWAIVAYLKHGIKPVSNTVPDSQDPPDHWASSYTPDKIGPYPLPTYPAGNEQFQP